jgi:hypothetical protein
VTFARDLRLTVDVLERLRCRAADNEGPMCERVLRDPPGVVIANEHERVQKAGQPCGSFGNLLMAVSMACEAIGS